MSEINLRHGIFLPPFHPNEENPTQCLERDLELIEWLDQLGFHEAWIGEHHSAGYEIISSPEIFIAFAAERTRHIRLRHRRHLAALSPPDDGRRPHRPARPHDARAGHVRRRAGPLGRRRDHDGHRPDDPARPHGRVARRDPAPVQGRDRHREDRLVHDGGGATAPPALYEALSRGRGGQFEHAVGRQARRQVRSQHDLRRRHQPVRLRGAGVELADRQRCRGRVRAHDGREPAASGRPDAYRGEPRAGLQERPLGVRALHRLRSTTTSRATSCRPAATRSNGLSKTAMGYAAPRTMRSR